MKIGLIKERKTPPDQRVALTPDSCARLLQKYPGLGIQVESSDFRAFTDQEYRDMGIPVVEDITDCEVLIGVKEVPLDALIPGKTYFFFSHTIKKQPYNRELLRAILRKNIDLHDHETLTDQTGHHRLVAFGRYAGLVGAYNGLMAYGQRTGLFTLPRAGELGSSDRIKELLTSMRWPPFRTVITGTGRVGSGVDEIMGCLPFEKLPAEEYLKYRGWNGVYCQIDVLDYNRKTVPGMPSKAEFFQDPSGYESNFFRFAARSDLFIAAHLYKNGAPMLLSEEDYRREGFGLKVIADISCDIHVPIASTIRPSTIEQPFYGYLRSTGEEAPTEDPGALTVMAVDNLPNEIPREASEGFARAFESEIIPAFFDQDSKGILERSRITHMGALTEKYAYLKDFVE